MSHWYALRCLARQEGFVVRALAEQELPLTGYAPLHTTEARFARRKATRTRALIPGYVFALLPDDDDAIQAALSIHGVVIDASAWGRDWNDVWMAKRQRERASA